MGVPAAPPETPASVTDPEGNTGSGVSRGRSSGSPGWRKRSSRRGGFTARRSGGMWRAVRQHPTVG